MAPGRSSPATRGREEGDRQAARRAGHRRRRHREAARARRDRRGDPPAVRGGARGAQDRRAWWLTRSSSRRPNCGSTTTASRRCAGLNLQVPTGSICGFLGSNGAGKTTTIKVLLGMARPTSGEARVFGLPAERRTGERGDPPPHRVRQRRQGALRLHDRGGDDPLHRRLLPALAQGSRAALPAHVRAAAGPQGQGAVARHAHEARVAAGALPRRRAARPRRADLGPRSRDDRGGAAGARRRTSAAKR